MNLESIPKFHAPKTQQFTDAPRATASDALSGTDVLGAIGMVQSRVPLGFSAFSGKMNLSVDDKKKAIQLLMQYGLKHCGKVAALRKLDTNVRGKVVQTLAMFAFASWSRSAATPGARCKDCHGTGRACNREVTELTGVFTEKECGRCAGQGYSKLSGLSVYRGVSQSISADQWKRGVSQFFESLISELDKSEAQAESVLKQVTASFDYIRK